MVDLLVIPDGAAQPVRGSAPTALEEAWTPVLDDLCAAGAVRSVAVTPEGLPAGSETGIPALLGAPPAEPLGRGWIDAAGYGVEVPGGLVPFRADVVYPDGRRASHRQVDNVRAHLRQPSAGLAGHRLLIFARTAPSDRKLLGLRLRVWRSRHRPERCLAPGTVMICAPGAAAGCARLLGAEVVIPGGATGDVDTDLRAKAQAAVAAAAAGAMRVIVHVGGPDEAAHRRDRAAAVDLLERIDGQLLGPLRDVAAAVGGRLAVCPDHGTDPAAGTHDPAPVPAVVWTPGGEPSGPDRLSERAVGTLAPIEPSELLGVAVA